MLDEARIQFGQLAKEELGALGFVSDYELSEQDRAEMDNDWSKYNTFINQWLDSLEEPLKLIAFGFFQRAGGRGEASQASPAGEE